MATGQLAEEDGRDRWSTVLAHIRDICTIESEGIICKAFYLTQIGVECALETAHILQSEQQFDSSHVDMWWIEIGIPLAASCLLIYLSTVLLYWIITKPKAKSLHAEQQTVLALRSNRNGYQDSSQLD